MNDKIELGTNDNNELRLRVGTLKTNGADGAPPTATITGIVIAKNGSNARVALTIDAESWERLSAHVVMSKAAADRNAAPRKP